MLQDQLDEIDEFTVQFFDEQKVSSDEIRKVQRLIQEEILFAFLIDIFHSTRFPSERTVGNLRGYVREWVEENF